MRGKTALLLLRKQWLANREGQEIPSQVKNMNFHEKKMHSTDINQVQAFLIFFNFLIQFINKVMLASDLEKRDPFIHIPTILQIIYPFRLLQSIEQNSLCYIVGPFWLMEI